MQPPLADLQRAGQLARAVQDSGARADGLAHERLDRRGDDRRHAGARDAASFGRLGLVPPDGDVADRDAGHVRDRVGRTGLELTDPQAELPQARAARSGRAVGSRARTVRSPREARHARRLERCAACSTIRAARSGSACGLPATETAASDRGDQGGSARGGRASRGGDAARGRRRCSRFTIRGSSSTCASAWSEWDAAGLPGGSGPGSRRPVRVRAPGPRLAAAGARGRVGEARLLRLRHDDARRAGHVGGRARGRGGGAHGRRPRRRGRARRLRVHPAAGPPRDQGRLRRLAAT